jgi:hypothetical protein
MYGLGADAPTCTLPGHGPLAAWLDVVLVSDLKKNDWLEGDI